MAIDDIRDIRWGKQLLAIAAAIALLISSAAFAADQAPGCPKITIPPDARVIGVGSVVGEALADIYTDDPNAPLSVIDLEIEPGDGRIFVVAATVNAAVWRFTGATDRVAGTLIAGDESFATGLPACSAVMGLEPETVTILPPKSCPIRAVGVRGSQYDAQQRLFVEMTGREMDSLLDLRVTQVAKIALPSGRVTLIQNNRNYRYPGAISPDIAPQAARLWLEFIKYFPGGLVDIDPDSVVSLHPATDYERLPGLLGLAQLVSEGALALSGTPNGLSDWWGGLGDNWINIDLADRLRQMPRTAPIFKDQEWLRTPLARASYNNTANDPLGPLHGKRYQLTGDVVRVEGASGDWVALDGLAFIIRGQFELPPGTPSQTNQPVFLLPSGTSEPRGPFGRELPLLREAVD